MKSLLKKTLNFLMIKSILILLLLLSTVGLFEFLPAVDQARSMFPEVFDKSYDCYDVLNNRPWYGRVNPWLWFWLISTPIIVFSVKPDAKVWQRASRTIFTIGISYIVINLATHLGMEIRNAPFHGEGVHYVNGILMTSEADKFKLHCFDIADVGKYVGALLFGWVYVCIYYGWWKMIWYQYHKRKTGLIDKRFKIDWINKIVIFISVVVPVLVALKFLVA